MLLTLVQPEPANVPGAAALLWVLPFVGGLMLGVSAQPRFGKYWSHSTGRYGGELCAPVQHAPVCFESLLFWAACCPVCGYSGD
jgi:hypothetical protein